MKPERYKGGQFSSLFYGILKFLDLPRDDTDLLKGLKKAVEKSSLKAWVCCF